MKSSRAEAPDKYPQSWRPAGFGVALNPPCTSVVRILTIAGEWLEKRRPVGNATVYSARFVILGDRPPPLRRPPASCFPSQFVTRPLDGYRDAQSRPACAGTEPRQQAARRAPTVDQPRDPLPHPRHRIPSHLSTTQKQNGLSRYQRKRPGQNRCLKWLDDLGRSCARPIPPPGIYRSLGERPIWNVTMKLRPGSNCSWSRSFTA